MPACSSHRGIGFKFRNGTDCTAIRNLLCLLAFRTAGVHSAPLDLGPCGRDLGFESVFLHFVAFPGLPSPSLGSTNAVRLSFGFEFVQKRFELIASCPRELLKQVGHGAALGALFRMYCMRAALALSRSRGRGVSGE